MRLHVALDLYQRRNDYPNGGCVPTLILLFSYILCRFRHRYTFGFNLSMKNLCNLDRFWRESPREIQTHQAEYGSEEAFCLAQWKLIDQSQ